MKQDVGTCYRACWKHEKCIYYRKYDNDNFADYKIYEMNSSS